MLDACNFCSKFGLHRAGTEPYDQILFESSNFVAVPTRGSIIPGWILIIPRAHFLCVGALSCELMREFISFREMVASALHAAFGPVAFFEHGPVMPCTSIGCGVDHAHLHLVATTVNLRAGANRIAECALNWAPVNRPSTLSRYHAEGLPYLYVQQFGESWICSPETIESQLFRKVIAAAVRRPQKYDWKQHCFISEIDKTLSTLQRGNVARIPAFPCAQ
jgi:ATP adenylyltransferase